jgi:hypothetical protein
MTEITNLKIAEYPLPITDGGENDQVLAQISRACEYDEIYNSGSLSLRNFVAGDEIDILIGEDVDYHI